MLKYFILIFCFCLSHNCCLYGQTEIIHYNSSNGLPHDITYNIFQDSRGYIWVGTDDGLAKFDGKNFKTYNIRDGFSTNYVMDVVELPERNYAVATWGGGLHFLKNDTLHKSSSFNDKNFKIYDIQYCNNQIVTNSGLGLTIYDLDSREFSNRIYDNKTNSFFNEVNPNISVKKLKPFFINSELYFHNQAPGKNSFRGIRKYNENSLKSVFSFLNQDNIYSVLIKDDSYVFGTEDKLVFCNSRGIKEEYQIKRLSLDEYVVKILKSPNKEDEYILMIKNDQGLKRAIIINTTSDEYINLNEKLSLSSSISDIIIDFEGNIWVSTFGDGIYCYYYSNPKIDNILTGNYFIDLEVTNDSAIYALSSNKLFEFKDDSIVNDYKINWSSKHLNIINNKPIISALDNGNIKNSSLNIKFGSFYDETKFGTVRQCDTILIDESIIRLGNDLFISDIEESGSELYLYTNKGKWIYNDNYKTFTKDSVFHLDLPSEHINDFLVSNDSIFIASDKGLILKYNDSIKVFNESNGLHNERVNCVLKDDSTLFLGTQSGLSMIKNDKVYNFSKSFGIESLTINDLLLFNNKLWVAGSNGISIIDKDDFSVSKPPKLNIHQKNNVFKYDVITYTDNNSVSFQYKINNDDWVTINNSKGSLDFNNFAPNKYEAVFRAKNSHSNWAKTANFYFQIELPWYKKWWVILIGILLVSSIIGLLFYMRLRAASKRNKTLKNEIAKRILAENELTEVRDNIARDFHDDLGNKLASISLLSDVLSNKMKAKEGEIIKVIKDDADYLYKGTKDFIFSLQEKSNYIDELVVYLTDFAEDYLHQFNIDFEVYSNITKPIKLPYYWSKQIIFIFKEAITNAVKHSKGKNVKMKFNVENNNLVIELVDNGIGFVTEGHTNSNGLTNMQSRAKRIGCNLKVHSKINEGVTIRFLGKLPQEGSYS